jgi:hypothetical protein
MRRGCFAALILFVIAAMALLLWSNRTGTFSYANFERISPGMSLVDVEDLLGSHGNEIPEPELPSIVDWGVPVGHPRRIKPVVTGDRYIRWVEGSSYIIISMRGGMVAEKWYWEPSL